MSLNYYDPHSRYRRRSLQRWAGILVMMGAMTCAVLIGFWSGNMGADQDGTMLREQLEAATAERDQLQNTVTELRAQMLTTAHRYEELQQTYHETVPEGPAQELMALVRKQIEEGVDPERMAFLLRSGRPPRNCTDPETARFVVSTPAYQGAQSQAKIGDGVITIKASGASAKNDQGKEEAWFDPAREITLEFTTKDGASQKKTGVMPMHHSIVSENREYRFTIASGAQSFAKVTFDSCDYP